MTDERIIAYLLEELPERDLEQFEDECFAQETWPEQVSLAEDDLIDAYLRDQLTQAQRQHFERNYLTTEARKERVMVAAALLRHVDECNDNSKPVVIAAPSGLTWFERWRAYWGGRAWALNTAITLGVVAIVAGGLLWLARSRPSQPQTFATLTLSVSTSNRAESARVSKVKLPLNADALRIVLKLPDGFPPTARYHVELESDNGAVAPLEMAGKDAQSVSVVIPATEIARGLYALSLFAIRPDGTEQQLPGRYFFAVE